MFTTRASVLALITFSIFSTSQAAAGFTVRFEEDAPKDRFIIENGTECQLGEMALRLDLRGSAAGLLFDTEGGGPGVNVFQPLDITRGQDYLERLPEIDDGDRAVTFSLKALPPGTRIILTVDVDDSQPDGPMSDQMIAGSEIAGARVSTDLENIAVPDVAFDQTGLARFPVIDRCPPS